MGGGALEARGAFSRRREGSREEGDGSDKLGETMNFLEMQKLEIFLFVEGDKGRRK